MQRWGDEGEGVDKGDKEKDCSLSSLSSLSSFSPLSPIPNC
ncbi:hypothetical protein [Nostoc linckia]|nr:hypothetical protein [Nostoc linckia]